MTVGERIRKIRKDHELTQEAFAKRIDSVQNTITGYETGRRIPSDQTLSLICCKFGVNENWLRYEEGDPYPNQSGNILHFSAAHPEMSDIDKALMEAYFSLSDAQKDAFLQYCLKVAEVYQAQTSKKNMAAARSGDRLEVVSVSAENEDAALPPSYSGDI